MCVCVCDCLRTHALRIASADKINLRCINTSTVIVILCYSLSTGTLLIALDLHGTGVSTSGAKAFLDVLKYNTTIEVLDLRRNPLIGESLNCVSVVGVSMCTKTHTLVSHLIVCLWWESRCALKHTRW